MVSARMTSSTEDSRTKHWLKFLSHTLDIQRRTFDRAISVIRDLDRPDDGGLASFMENEKADNSENDHSSLRS